MTDPTPAPTMPDPWTMTPGEAGAWLAEMSTAASPPPPIAPETSAGARARLDMLAKDSGFATAVFSGDMAANQEFKNLTTLAAGADDVADAVAGTSSDQPFEVTVDGQLPRRAIADFVASMRESGVSDAAIAQALRGDKVPRREFDAVRMLQRARHGDADWCKRLLSGDYTAGREHKLMSIVLSAEIEDAA
jgi:hypothetical protein